MGSVLWLEEIALMHRVPPWEIDVSRRRPGAVGRVGWRLRALVYRVGLRRLAVVGLAVSE
jgi:hypothetical protein